MHTCCLIRSEGNFVSWSPFAASVCRTRSLGARMLILPSTNSARFFLNLYIWPVKSVCIFALTLHSRQHVFCVQVSSTSWNCLEGSLAWLFSYFCFHNCNRKTRTLLVFLCQEFLLPNWVSWQCVPTSLELYANQNSLFMFLFLFFSKGRLL